MASVDWIAFNIGQAVGVRSATPAEAALGGQLVPGLLASLPAELELALRVADFLAS